MENMRTPVRRFRVGFFAASFGMRKSYNNSTELLACDVAATNLYTVSINIYICAASLVNLSHTTLRAVQYVRWV